MESSSWKYHCEPQVKVGIVSGVTIHFALNGPYTVLGHKAVGARWSSRRWQMTRRSR